MAAGGAPDTVARDLAEAVHAAGDKLPGFGHPVHRPLDPRAERILELADDRGVSGPHVALARAFRDAAAETWGKPLTMNVALPIAAVMLDLGFSADVVKSVPILARTAGLLAHLAEERANPVGFLMAGKAEEAIAYEPPSGVRHHVPGMRVCVASVSDTVGSSDARPPKSSPVPGRSSSRSTMPATEPSSPTSSSARPSTARS